MLFSEWSLLQEIGERRRRISVYISSAEVFQEVVVGSLRLLPDHGTQAGTQLRLHGQSRELREDCTQLICRNEIQPRTNHVNRDSRVSRRDLWLLMQSDRTRCVQSDRIPYQLDLLRWDTTILEERPGGIGSVDLESIVF